MGLFRIISFIKKALTHNRLFAIIHYSKIKISSKILTIQKLINLIRENYLTKEKSQAKGSCKIIIKFLQKADL